MISTKYQNTYEEFLNYYKNKHVNPWHNISESNLKEIYEYLINSIDIDNIYNFNYFINYIIKRLSGSTDAHTKFELLSIIPINFRIFGNEILVNYPKYLRGSSLISINGIDINKIILELDDVITYGTKGKRKYELEKALFNKIILFGLPSLRKAEELDFEILTLNGEKIHKIIKRNTTELNTFDHDKYRFGKVAAYNFVDNCLIYYHSSVQKNFAKIIEDTILRLRKENLSNIDTIIVDIRGNTGGNSTLNNYLLDFLKEHLDKKIICLTDYRVFSGGRYALIDLINLGAITIGEEISTPINCYGNSSWQEINKYWFSVSSSYLNPITGLSISSKEEFKKYVTKELEKPIIYLPDILVEEQKEDYMNNVDTIMNYAIKFSKRNRGKKC